MGKETLTRVKIVRKPSLNETLKNLPLGEPRKFSVYDFKIQAVRGAISDFRTKKKTHDFTITEAGMVNEYIVTRIR